MGLGRIASDGYGTNLPLVILLGATAADITVITTEPSWLHSSSHPNASKREAEVLR